MKDEQKRIKGTYTEVYSKIIYGVKVEITEETKVGRDFEIIGFSRGYNPAIPFKQ